MAAMWEIALYTFLGLVLLGFVYSMTALSLGIMYPWQLFYSRIMTIKQFKILLNIAFDSKNFMYDAYKVYGGEYTIWHCNRYYGFNVNEVYGFSAYQKYLFFKRFNAILYNKQQEEIKKKLKLHMLSPAGQVLFKENK